MSQNVNNPSGYGHYGIGLPLKNAEGTHSGGHFGINLPMNNYCFS